MALVMCTARMNQGSVDSAAKRASGGCSPSTLIHLPPSVLRHTRLFLCTVVQLSGTLTPSALELGPGVIVMVKSGKRAGQQGQVVKHSMRTVRRGSHPRMPSSISKRWLVRFEDVPPYGEGLFRPKDLIALRSAPGVRPDWHGDF